MPDAGAPLDTGRNGNRSPNLTDTTITKKIKMTADDLKGVYSVKFGVPKERFVIHANPQLGWTVTVIGHYSELSSGAEVVEQLTRSLRLVYELKV